MQFIDLKTQAARIETALFGRWKSIMDNSCYIMGPDVFALEKELADYVGVSHALGVASGTDALLIALMALDIGPGDEVVVPAFTFFAPAEVIALLQAKPVFVDIDPMTYNMDAALLEAAITEKTKAILPVSLYGQCADFTAINAIAKRYGLPVIEDAAQSFGAKLQDRFSCGLTTIGCTSFFPSKPLGAYGDGGACFTDDPILAQRMEEIRLHGQSARYLHTRLGINGRLDTFQAAVLLEKMHFFEEEIELRQEVAKRYQQLLPETVRKPEILTGYRSVFAQYTIEVDHREAVQKALNAKGIPTAVHYPVGLHQQPILKERFPDAAEVAFPVTESAAKRVLSLPMHPYLTEEMQKTIAHELVEALESVASYESIE